MYLISKWNVILSYIILTVGTLVVVIIAVKKIWMRLALLLFAGSNVSIGICLPVKVRVPSIVEKRAGQPRQN